jgi:hypothetical protein
MVPRAGVTEVEKRKFFTLPGLELPPLGEGERRGNGLSVEQPEHT